MVVVLYIIGFEYVKNYLFQVFIFPLKPKLYRSVIEDVINDVRDIFLDDGVDEQVLMELKTVSWPLFVVFNSHAYFFFFFHKILFSV